MQYDGQSMTKKEGYYVVKGESITMEKMHPYEPYRLELLPVIHSKCEEFLLLGYDKVSVDYFWDFLKNNMVEGRVGENRDGTRLVMR